jgi:type IV pilus assembly protein PilO
MTPVTRVLAPLALAYVAVLGGYAWYTSARETRAAARHRRALPAHGSGAQAGSRALQTGEFELKLAEVRQTLVLVDNVVPREAALESLQRLLAEVARRQALRLQRTSAKAEVAKDVYAEIPIELEASGSLSGLLGFVVQLQRLPRLLSLGDVRIEHAEAQRFRLKRDRHRLPRAAQAMTERYLTI